MRHSGHLRTLEKCRKHSPAAHVFYISPAFSNVHCVSSQRNTQLRLLYLLHKTQNEEILQMLENVMENILYIFELYVFQGFKNILKYQYLELENSQKKTCALIGLKRIEISNE